MSAADTDYIPASMRDRIIAHTPLSAPGETVRWSSRRPAPGDYPYICTFPGHYMMMQGTMTSRRRVAQRSLARRGRPSARQRLPLGRPSQGEASRSRRLMPIRTQAR